MTKRQLKLLKFLYKKPRSTAWVMKKFKVNDIREICSGIYDCIRTTDDNGDECDVLFIASKGIIAVESAQWFNLQFVLLQIVLPIIIAVITTLITIFLTTLLSPSL
mgnify:CR=1 FL=1|jgi:hypothetical protein